MHKYKYLLFCLVVLLLLSLSMALNVFAETINEPLVTIMLFDTDLREALNEIAIQTEVNIICDDTVGGHVTADLIDVPLEKALKMILFTGGFSYRKVDDFYYVGLPDPRNATFRSLVETEVIELKYVKAQNIIEQLPSFLTTYVKGTSTSNLLTISAPPQELERIKYLITQLDAPIKTVEIKVLVTEMSEEAIKELGNTLLEFKNRKNPDASKDWSFKLDFDAKDNIFTMDTSLWGVISNTLKLLEEKQEAKIHADPNVTVAHGETAELFIGERRTLIVRSETSDVLRSERIEAGVSLKVTPTVMGNDVILNIAPEISHFANEKRQDATVRRNAVSTTIRLTNGQTAILSGMTMEGFSDLSSKVPILGDIPIIRWLFRRDVKQTSYREVFTFVTPVIH